MNATDVSRLVRDLIVRGSFPCELVFVQQSGQVWRITLRDERGDLVSFDVLTGLRPSDVREAVQTFLESKW